ncbi:trypsin-like peptidase domain-containing protein [Streptomyces turgidiscabies]|uniref:Trypsin n=1 Tax=Streptomyces turgidiscabies (strain Car8) TaxID=698760 RepID=L7FES3_STRT8|nr:MULTISPECIES: trypsin-like peptidase domain-containing protein [Streptomyces]ELP69699.1 hypothetical protein STRTUCAR8_00072 [Streptomyces turgidiscabies Car8]MDX3500086.1 trypsin-like peptidase domain-containing protein [Streptomyces turgidiscabies]GAQ77141.1 hypothetical protein T45_08957 [Streptomyces turgidiscabies]
MRGVHGVNTLSFSALYIEAWFRSRGEGPDVRLGSGTGFLVGVPDDFWLVTAGHVVSGRNTETGELEDDRGLWPDYLRVRFARQGEGGEFEPVDQEVALYADGDEAQVPVWRSPAQQRADVAAVPIGSVPEGAVDAFLLTGWPTVRDLYPQDRRAGAGAEADAELPLRVMDRLYVLGFPFGDTGSWPFAVWTAAPVASEPLARWNGLPGFLLDSRTRSGQSGAPVLMHIRPGEMVLAGGEVHVHEEWVTALVGVYSGRLNENSDLGMVWTTEVLDEILPEFAPKRPPEG